MRKAYWIILFSSVALTIYLSTIDDQEYPQSHDSMSMIMGVGTFYTLFFFSLFSGVFYGITDIPLRKRNTLAKN